MRVLPQTLKAHLFWLGPSLALGALGLSQLHSFFSGQVQGLLHPTFHPLVLISGFLLTLLAVLRVVFSGPESMTSIPLATWTRFILVGAVILLVMVVEKTTPKTGYSALAFDNRGFQDQAMPIMSSKFNEVTAQGMPADNQVLECEVVDLLMAASDSDMVKSLEGRHVHFIGQFLPLNEHAFQIVRLMMYCCAADAQPVGMQIEGQAKGFERMDWIQIDGVAHFQPDGKSWTPQLKLEKIAPTPAPKEIFLY